MNVVEKASASLRPNAVDFDRFRLRRFIESLPADELETRTEPDRSRRPCRGDGRQPEGGAVPFRRSREGRNWSATSWAAARGSRRRSASSRMDLLEEIQRRLRNKPEIFEVSRAEAPCQAVVLTGDDADVTKLPVHLQHGADGAPYISASIDYVIDPKTGWTNVGLRRLMLRGRRPKPASIWSRRATCGDL